MHGCVGWLVEMGVEGGVGGGVFSLGSVFGLLCGVPGKVNGGGGRLEGLGCIRRVLSCGEVLIRCGEVPWPMGCSLTSEDVDLVRERKLY